MEIKERAIILQKTKYAEADLILRILTSNGQIYSAIAKSALKSKKRFGGGVLEPTHYVALNLTKKPDENFERLAIVNEASIINDFPKLKSDYDRLDLALQFVRTVNTVAREGDSQLELFNLLGHALKECEVTEKLQLLKLQFQLKVLHSQGVLEPTASYAPFVRASIRSGENFPVSAQQISILSQDIEKLLNQYTG